MKLKLLSITLLLAGTLAFFFGSHDSVVPVAPVVSPSIDERPAETAEQYSRITTSQKPIAEPLAEKAKQNHELESAHLIVNTDQQGHQKHLQLKSLHFVQDLLDSKDSLNPAIEFESLLPVDFRDQESTMLTGVFYDRSLKLGLSLSWIHETFELTGSSCLLLPNGQLITSEKGQFEMRTDSRGYAMISIGEGYILRLTYFIGSGRSLVGKLFQKKDLDWQLISSMNAKELEIGKTRSACPFKPNIVPDLKLDK